MQRRLHEKILWILKRTRNKYNSLWKENNVTVNKKRITITLRGNIMLYLKKNIHKNYQKVRDHCHSPGKYRDTSYSICKLRFNVPNEIRNCSFHSGSNHDYHFTIKELAKKNWGAIWMSWRKYWKVQNHFSYNRKEIKKLIKMAMKTLYQYLAK